MRRITKGAVCAIGLPLLASCGAHYFAGVDLRPGRAPAELQAMARAARDGDKRAQFNLADKLERGFGVRRNVAAAETLFKAAASDSGGRIWVYHPSPGNGAPARVLPVERPRWPGLPEAAARLRAIGRASS